MSATRYIKGLLALLFLLALLYWLLFPLLFLVTGVLLPLAALLAPSPVLKTPRDRLEALLESLGVLLIFIWAYAMARALVVLAKTTWSSFPADLFAKEVCGFNDRAIALMDAGLGGLGVVLSVWGGFVAWRKIFLQARQIENIPTSKAASVALGLAELRGVARPAGDATKTEEEAHGPDPRFWRDVPPGHLLLWAHRFNKNPSGEISTGNVDSGLEKRSTFYLEDETGRVLVDPRGAGFWKGEGVFFWESIRKVFLMLRRTDFADPKESSWFLMPGDPVYVLGAVEENPDAPPDAVDSERLVIRPRSMPRETGLLRGLFSAKDSVFGDKHSDIPDVFLLTDAKESDLTGLLRKEMRQVWITMLAVACLTSWLCAFQLQNFRRSADPDFFIRTPQWRRQQEQKRLDEIGGRLEAVQSGSIEAIPDIIEALRSSSDRLREKGLAAMGKISYSRPEARAAIPALIEVLRACDVNVPYDNQRLNPPDVTAANHAALLLGSFGAAAEPAVPALLELLQHRDVLVRYHAASGLKLIGPAAARALPALRVLAEQDPSPGVREEAGRAAARIEAKARTSP